MAGCSVPILRARDSCSTYKYFNPKIGSKPTIPQYLGQFSQSKYELLASETHSLQEDDGELQG